MRKKVSFALLIALLGILCAGFFQQAKRTGEVLNYGLFTFEEVENVSDPGSVHGEHGYVEGWRWSVQTTTIPAEVGTAFGISYKINGKPDEEFELTEIITFPGDGLTNPETGETQKTNYYFTYAAGDEVMDMGYMFDEPWEAAKGDWVFQVKYGAQILVEKTFSVE